MRYQVSGADRETGADIELVIEAQSDAEARQIANDKGVLVAWSEPLAARGDSVPQGFNAQPIPRPESGHYHGHPIVNVAMPRRGSSLGIASIVLGGLAFLFCWIPFINLIGVPLSTLGILLGIIGFIVALGRRGASVGYPIAGVVVSGVALLVAISITGAFTDALQKAADEMSGSRTGASSQSSGAVESQTASSRTSRLSSSSAAVPSRNPSESLVSQEVEVRVVRARTGKVPVKTIMSDATEKSESDLLMVFVQIENRSDTKKIDYQSWAEDSFSYRDRVRLTDNFGNTYRRIDFGFGTEVEGASGSKSIYPGDSALDVLVFEQPVPRAEHLDIELPMANVGGEGKRRIRISASDISR